MGQLIATRVALMDAIRLMTPPQRKALTDTLAALRGGGGLVKRWGDASTIEFRANFLDEFEAINFRIGQRNKIAPGDDPGTQQRYFVCLKCDTPVIPFSLGATCSICGSGRWLELAGV